MNSAQSTTLCRCTVIAAFLLSAVNAGLVQVDECGNDLPTPAKVSVADCDAPPCNFVIGSVVLMNMTFLIEEDYKAMFAGAKARISELEIPYPLPQYNACESLLNNRCPLESGEIITYQLRMPILDIFPPIDNFEVIFTMHADFLQLFPFLCFTIPARIVLP